MVSHWRRLYGVIGLSTFAVLLLFLCVYYNSRKANFTNSGYSDYIFHHSNETQICSRNMDGKGPINVTFYEPTYEELYSKFPNISLGGHYKPLGCKGTDKVAIIICYRDRDAHLRIILNHLHEFLQRQNIEYAIFVVEQAGTSKFNRALMLNIGFAEAQKFYDWDCVILHDVDLFAEDDRNLYTCPQKNQIKHMTGAIDKYNYKLLYEGHFGGVTIFNVDTFLRMNGMPNDYWGWGSEDDDAYKRALSLKQSIFRYPPEFGRFKMIRHERDKNNEENPCRQKLQKQALRRSDRNGLNTLSKVNYKVLDMHLTPVFTKIVVDVDEAYQKYLARNPGNDCNRVLKSLISN